MIYASIVWWTSMEYVCNIKTVRKQRTCCLGISGAFRTTSTGTMEALLSIEPIEIDIRYEAPLAAKQLETRGKSGPDPRETSLLHGWIKGERKTELGVYIENTTELLFRLPDYCSVLQAEVRTITECIRGLNVMERTGL
ncbi:hypothetical protein EVAR_74155_1 [Eumeta japonica]|uniref:Uncharacterized protein n=1 Tax=Eumeta variegata TaxID=151549 RepID=A0A4C1SQ06_EUMVA|nr:hypothetical protein EVAR_74155_1 [Eumeta japonica]